MTASVELIFITVRDAARRLGAFAPGRPTSWVTQAPLACSTLLERRRDHRRARACLTTHERPPRSWQRGRSCVGKGSATPLRRREGGVSGGASLGGMSATPRVATDFRR